MTTKDISSSSLKNNILESFGNDNNYDKRQFINLNLNKTDHKCTTLSLSHSQNKSNNDKYLLLQFLQSVRKKQLYTVYAKAKIAKNAPKLFFELQQHSNVSDSYKNPDKYNQEFKSLKSSWSKSINLSSNPLLDCENEIEGKNRWKTGYDSSSFNNKNSTLSLHITAYENSIEAKNEQKDKILEKTPVLKSQPFKNVKESMKSSSSGIQNSFEIPRYISNETATPEVMQFKTSQRLFIPNATTPGSEEEDDKTGPLLGTIFGVFGGILIIGLFAFGGFFLYRRYRRRRAAAEMEGDQELQFALPPSSTSAASSAATASTTTANKPLPLNNSDESPPQDPDVEKSVSIPKTMKNTKSINVVHIDHTDVMVPAELKKEETRSLLKSMKKTQKIQSVHDADVSTTISKVLTYCTDDDITMNDRSARETCDDLNGSGKPSEIEALLMRLISHGPRQYSFKFDELQQLLEAATKVFEEEPSLLECPVPCTVYGDIHGQYSDLHRWFNLNGWPHQNRSVFLGDFVDRGSHGVEVIALLTCLKIVYPDKIYIVRGNHEEESLNRAYSFYEEVICRFSADSSKQGKDGYAMYEHFKNLFMQLPLAVLIGGRVLGMHGGLSPKMESLQAIRDIKRPIDDFEVGSLECDLVWSDPDTAADTGFRPNLDREPNNGIGQLFAADTVKETCDRLNIDLIIRGHQAPLHGYALFADGRMMTLFSAPGYKGNTAADVNMGACIEFDKEMKITIKQIKVSEKFRQNRVNDVEKMKIQRKELRKRIAALKGSEKKAG